MNNKYIRLYNTVKYLKIKQIYFRIFYFARNRYRKKIGFNYPTSVDFKRKELLLDESIPTLQSYKKKNEFEFLNLSKKFNDAIDWNFFEYGKLWTYNISYFDFLNQTNISKEESLKLIYDFIKNDSVLKDAIEPFPISLRGINWVKFLTKNAIEDKEIDSNLYKHYQILMDNLEYHLLGNHLLENSFALLFGSYYFEDEAMYQKAKEILTEELEEQILEDGAHFELTPMYHQIMLFRVLDCINLIKNNSYKNHELLDFLKNKASIMKAWLEVITYKNGEIPLLNDSAMNIAPKSKELFEYAKRLDVNTRSIELKESGYRKIEKSNYECIIDIGHIGPDYIPGHAHSDTFNYELYIDENPFIVDTGLSTYESNDRRTYERSTTSHNTVEINSTDQSEVWGGFRVANRAKIIKITEEENSIEATHDGYKKQNIFHTRKWKFEDNKIIIKDALNQEASAIARMHFHPSITKEDIEKRIDLNNIDFKYIAYDYAPEFNKLIKSIAIEIKFKKDLEMEIQI